jgi:DNA-binding GntR family transcriptional regulator
MSIQALGPVPDQWRNILRQHDEFIAALEARDEAKSAATLRAHLDGTHRR